MSATFGEDDESTFVRIYNADYIRSAKRLYMTATPRIYGDSTKVKAESGEVTLCSMDDKALNGKELFVINFSEAVQRRPLTDYKVLVSTVEESIINRRLQELLRDESNSSRWTTPPRSLAAGRRSPSRPGRTIGRDNPPMKRAVTFCQVISPDSKSTKHKVSFINIASIFKAVVMPWLAFGHPNARKYEFLSRRYVRER